MHYWKVQEKLPAPIRRREEVAKDLAAPEAVENPVNRIGVQRPAEVVVAGAVVVEGATTTKTSISFSARSSASPSPVELRYHPL